MSLVARISVMSLFRMLHSLIGLLSVQSFAAAIFYLTTVVLYFLVKDLTVEEVLLDHFF